MRKSVIGIFLSIPLAVTALVACSSDDDSAGGGGGATANGGANAAGKANSEAGAPSGGAPSGGKGGAPSAGAPAEEAGAGGALDTPDKLQPAVYTMSNDATANQVLGFLRAADGALTPMASGFPTGGKGSGAGLGEQGAVAYDLAQQRIYVVNAGDHSFSVFSVKDDGTLSTAANVTTAGFGADAASLLGPKSITFHGDTVYVLYEGTASVPSMIAGYAISKSAAGVLSGAAIAGSALALSSATASVDPAQIEFTPDGKWLIVSEKATNKLDSFGVGATGLATKKDFYDTAKVGATAALQLTPFGFEFLGSTLVVSEAGSTGVGTYSYANGVIAATATGQFLPTDPAPCWVAVKGNYAYVTNTKGPNVSGFEVSAAGALSNIGPIANGIVASTGLTIPDPGGTIFQGPTDEFVSEDGKYLYILNSAVPSIGIFGIEDNGTLTRVGAKDYTPGALMALPKGSAGIVAR